MAERRPDSGSIPVSVHILTFNSAATLERALRSVEGAAEILVIDGGSTDKTIEIANNFGATILNQRDDGKQGTALKDFAAARNRGLHATQQEWILALDSDEYVSPELWKEIYDAVMSNAPAAYKIPRRYVLPNGKIVRHATGYPNERIYFFHRSAVTRWQKPVHERVGLKTGYPLRRFRHASMAPIGSVEQYRKSNERYIAIEKQRDNDKGWLHWLRHRVWHTVRSRIIIALKLLWIWFLPFRGTRLPLRQELMKFWYGWRLIVETCPLRKNQSENR